MHREDDANPFSGVSCTTSCVVAVEDIYGGADGFYEVAIGSNSYSTFPSDFFINSKSGSALSTGPEFTLREVTTFDDAVSGTSYGKYPVMADLDNDGKCSLSSFSASPLAFNLSWTLSAYR